MSFIISFYQIYPFDVQSNNHIKIISYLVFKLLTIKQVIVYKKIISYLVFKLLKIKKAPTNYLRIIQGIYTWGSK